MQPCSMQPAFIALRKSGKKDGKEKIEEMYEQKVKQMIKSAEGSAWLLHKITKATAWRGVHIFWKQRRRMPG